MIGVGEEGSVRGECGAGVRAGGAVLAGTLPEAVEKWCYSPNIAALEDRSPVRRKIAGSVLAACSGRLATGYWDGLGCALGAP
jgi:hypothetical protein